MATYTFETTDVGEHRTLTIYQDSDDQQWQTVLNHFVKWLGDSFGYDLKDSVGISEKCVERLNETSKWDGAVF